MMISSTQKRYVAIAAAVVLAIGALAVAFPSTRAFSGGTGEWDDPYVITTCLELRSIADDNSLAHLNYVLGNDIDCAGVYFYPIGNQEHLTDSFPNYTFTGRFDGAGHTIRNVTVGSTTSNNPGLFGMIAGAYIHNVTLDEFIVRGDTSVGILAGRSAESGIVGVTLTASSSKNGTTFTGNPGGDPYNGSTLVGLFFSTALQPTYVYNPAGYTEPSSYTSVGSCAALNAAIVANPLGWYELSGDINCAGNANWIPFSTSSTAIFSGRLDGNGHTISGLSLTSTSTADRIGLFKSMYGVVVRDLVLTGTGFVATSTLAAQGGALAGLGSGVVVINVDSTVPVTMGDGIVGGLIGEADGVFIDVDVDADLSVPDLAQGEMGGIAGSGWWVDIRNSTYEGSLLGGYAVGGITGNVIDVNLNNVHATSTIDSNIYYGGLSGAVFSASSTITNSTADVIVNTSTLDVSFEGFGGLAGLAWDTNIVNSSASSTVTLDDALFGNGELFGGLVGDAEINDDSHGYENATSTMTLRINPADGAEWENIGGLVGEMNDRFLTTTALNTVYASSTIVIGSVARHPGQVMYVGGIYGTGSSGADNTSGRTSITILGDTATTYVEGIGGFSGMVEDILNSTSILSTIDITANAVYGVGGFAGLTDFAELYDGYASTTITITSPSVQAVGGLIGETWEYIDRFFVQGSITIATGQDDAGLATSIGGLAGAMYGSIINDVYTAVDVDVTSSITSGSGGSYFGGFVGYLSTTADLENTYTDNSLVFHQSGGAATFSEIGGHIGYSDDPSNSVIDSFAATLLTPVSGSTNIGGFVGSSTEAETFTNNAYVLALSSPYLCSGTDVSDPVWCTGRTASFLQDDANQPLASWDFGSVWDEHTCRYPTLQQFASLFGSCGGGGATEPTLTTSAASDVTETTATLNGSISSEGSATPTTRGFAYGLTTSYGATTTEAGSFSTGAYTASVSSLTCATTYHQRSYATSVDGTGYGSDSTFTTSACPVGGGGGSGGGGGRHDVHPPEIKNLKATILYGYPIIEWETDEKATTQLAYGPTQCLGEKTVEKDKGKEEKTKHVVILPASACKNSAHFSAISADAAGNRTISPGKSHNIQLCPSTSPPATPALLDCPSAPVPPTPVPARLPFPFPVPTPASVASVPPPAPVEPLTVPPTVVVNEGNPVTPEPVVSVVVTPPPGTVEVVLYDPEDPTDTMVLPVIEEEAPIETEWELCDEASECADGQYTLASYFIAEDGTETDGPNNTIRLDRSPQELETATSTVSVWEVATSFFRTLIEKATEGADDSSLLPLSMLEPIRAVGVTVGIVGIVWTLLSTLRRIGDLPLLVYRGLTTLFAFGYLRRRDRAWGTAYDSQTRRPLDPVVVTLYDAAGKQLKTVITDLDGRYAFLVPEGTYSIDAQKGHHTFPARNIPLLDPVYPAPYTGGSFPVGQEGVIMKDIPLDPTEFDWNEQEKYRQGLYRFFSRFDRPLAYLALVLTPLGAAVSVVAAIISPTVFNIVFVVLYIVIGILYLSGLGPRIYGMVRDSLGAPLAYAVLRAFRPGEETSHAHAVADQFGRYYLLLPPGETFEIQVEERTGAETYTSVYRSRYEGLHGYFNKTIRL